MKTLTLIFMLFFISTANARLPVAHTLKVEILNLGADNCVLTKSEILTGSVTGVVPGMLPGTGLVFQFQVSKKSGTTTGGVTDADFRLTYQCGPDKQVTLHTKQSYKKNHYHGQIDAIMEDSVGVYETHEVTVPKRAFGEHSDRNGGTVRWTIWN